MSPEQDRISNTAVVGLLLGGGFAVAGALIGASMAMGPAAIPIWLAVAVFGWLTSRGPLGQAVADRLRGGPAAPSITGVPEEIYAELDDLRTRMLEMETRQDFSERLLTQQKGSAQGDPGSQNGGQ